MHFLVIYGPPAAGKMSVGDEITRLTGIPVFHNHLSIEPVLRFFEFGTPAFGRLVNGFRRNLIEEIAHSDLPGVIFTFVWSFDHPGDRDFLGDLCTTFEDVGAEIAFIELRASLDERLRRNRTEKRLAEKPSKRNLERSEQNLRDLEQYRMQSENDFPFEHRHLVIDNTDRSAAEVGADIVEVLGIPLAD
ncbi:MAG: AAA family ATPase [Pseudomonadota bacterium]